MKGKKQVNFFLPSRIWWEIREEKNKYIYNFLSFPLSLLAVVTGKERQR